MSAVLAIPKPKVSPQTREPYPISVAQYLRMVQTGILGKYDRCELIEGVLVAKMSRNPPHDGTLHRLSKFFFRSLPDEFQSRDQKAIILDDSVPEPDLVVARGNENAFDRRHPTAVDTVLVVEVAESSLSLDRGQARLFARNAIPVYWIVNLVEFIVEVYSQPSGPCASPAYASRRDFARGMAVPLILDGVQVALLQVSDLLP